MRDGKPHLPLGMREDFVASFPVSSFFSFFVSYLFLADQFVLLIVSCKLHKAV